MIGLLCYLLLALAFFLLLKQTEVVSIPMSGPVQLVYHWCCVLLALAETKVVRLPLGIKSMA